jgi:CheY-like chemotaxis protein
MSSPRRLAVLVVDDHPDTAQTTARMVDLFGHRAECALSAAEALDSAARSPPDVVLMDIRLADGTGWAAGRRIADGAARRPVLVAVTGDHLVAGRYRQEGFDHGLLKPVEPAVLGELLDHYADRLADEPSGENQIDRDAAPT